MYGNAWNYICVYLYKIIRPPGIAFEIAQHGTAVSQGSMQSVPFGLWVSYLVATSTLAALPWRLGMGQ